MPAHHATSDPSFPTQSELRELVSEVEGNALSRQLFFDASRFRAIIDLDGIVVALNDFATQQRRADVSRILNRPFWDDPIFAGDPLWEGRLRSRFAEALASPTDTIEYEERVDLEDEAPLLLRVRIAVIRNREQVPIGFLLDSQDVGREHRSRALVREQQRLLHVVFERTFQLVAILDATGRIIDVNDAISQIGLTREIAVGRTIMELGSGESKAREQEWQARVEAMQTATEPRRYFDVRDHGPMGPLLATDVSMTPVRNDDGTLDLILLEFREQTERYEAEERLRESEERLRLLVEALPQMVWSAGSDGRIQYLSPSWQEFTGRTIPELLASDWLDILHPDDHEETLWGFGDAPVVEREFRMRNRHGEYRWMHTRARSVVDAAGEVRAWYGATTDITERRAAEDRFRAQSQQIVAAAELSGLGSFVWDLATDELSTDERWAIIMGLTADELGPDTWAGFRKRLHPEDQDRVQAAIERCLKSGQPSFNEVFRIVLDEGEDGIAERWVESLASVEFDAEGKPLRMFGAIQDVTADRLEEEGRVRLQKVEAIGTLVGAIAHDFNNVIGAVLTYARVAEAEMKAGEMPEESVAEIARGARRAADILGRLMAYGREETPRRIRFDVAEVVDEAGALVRPTLKAGTTLDIAVPGDLPPLDGDPTQIHQVMVNLLTNAGQAVGDAQSGRVTVRGAVVDLDGSAGDGLDPGRYVRLTVQDNGPGFPPGIAHRLFDPFFTTKPTGQGTGLGLSAVQSIVRAHRGSVTALEPPAGGAMFSVLLPVVEDAATPGVTPSGLPDLDAAGTVPEPGSPASEPPAPAPRRRVSALFVDDEPALVRLAGRAMPYRDIDVSGHVDAVEALALFAATPQEFDVLVTDLSMPGMTGFELIDQIREIRPGFPVVLTSGYLGPADEQAAADRKIDAVLPKPCSIDDIASAVRRITE